MPRGGCTIDFWEEEAFSSTAQRSRAAVSCSRSTALSRLDLLRMRSSSYSRDRRSRTSSSAARSPPHALMSSRKRYKRACSFSSRRLLFRSSSSRAEHRDTSPKTGSPACGLRIWKALVRANWVEAPIKNQVQPPFFLPAAGVPQHPVAHVQAPPQVPVVNQLTR